MRYLSLLSTFFVLVIADTSFSQTPAVSFNPASLTFSNQAVGTSSAPQSSVLTNTGSSPLSITSITATGDYSQTNNCPLASGGTAGSDSFDRANGALGSNWARADANLGGSFSIMSNQAGDTGFWAPSASRWVGSANPADQFSQATISGITGNLRQAVIVRASGTAFTNYAGGMNAYDFSGNGYRIWKAVNNVRTSLAYLSTQTLQLGDVVRLEVQGSALTLKVNGVVVLTASDSSIASGDPGIYAISDSAAAPLFDTWSGGALGGNLAAGASCTINVTFTPTNTGTRNGSISVTDNAPGSPQSLGLTGTGITNPSSVTFNPTSLTFAGQPVGTSSGSQPSTLTNTGSSPLSITSITALGDYSQTNNCPLASGGSAASDSFDRANGALGSNWARADANLGGAFSILSNQAGDTGFWSLSASRWVGSANPADQFSQATITGLTANLREGVIVRASGTAFTNYVGGTNAYDFSGSGYRIWKNVNNVRTSLAYTPSQTMQLGDVVRLEVQGASLTLKVNGLVVLTTTDSSITSGDPGIYAISDSSAAPLFDTWSGGALGGNLAVGGSCTINVTFTPTNTGTRSGSISVADNATGSPQTLGLTGTGLAPPTASLSPGSLTFAGQSVGTSSPSQPVTLSNTGGSALGISGISASGDFSETDNCGTSLAAGGNCTINVTFTPTNTGTRNGTLSVNDTAAGSPQSIPLTGTGTSSNGPSVNLNPSSLSFAGQVVGTTSTSQSVTLTNTGLSNLTVSSIGADGDYIQSNNCGAGGATAPSSDDFNRPNGVLGPNWARADATLGGSFNLSSNQAVDTGFFSLSASRWVGTTNPADQFSQATVAAVTGNKRQAVIVRATNSTFTNYAGGFNSYDFSGPGYRIWKVVNNVRTSLAYLPTQTMQVGDVVRLQVQGTTLTLTVNGNNILTATDNSISSGDPGLFAISDSGTAALFDNWSGGGLTAGTVAPNGSCTINVSFAPTATGSRLGTLVVNNNAPGSPHTATLSGTGLPQTTVSFTPASVTFSSQVVNTNSAPQTIQFSNTGSTSLTISAIAASGDFSQTNNCPSSLAPSATCNINVIFTPTTTGSRNGSITVTDNGAGSPQSASLTGTGVAAQVTPRVVALTPAQTQQFSSSITNPTWLVDGIIGGSASVGTINASGLYTAPSSAGSHTITAQGSSGSGNATVYITTYAGTFTYHNDLARTGANLNETVLTPLNVNRNQFGKLFSYPVDGYVYAEPLYASGISILNKGTHNVVYVATENDSVYAFDADGTTQTPLWKVSFINPQPCADPNNCVSTVPGTDTVLPGTPPDIVPSIGITGTPVIDRSSSTIYVVAKTKEVVNGVVGYAARLHALDLSTGAEKFGGPILIQPTFAGNGESSVNGVISFVALHENQRPALALSNSVVYVGFGSHNDVEPYHGWLVGYNATSLAQVAVLNTTPNGCCGGVWQSGAAPPVDSLGNLYVSTGHGAFDATTGGPDYGISLLKVSPVGGLTVADWFAPYDQATLSDSDLDMSAGGIMVLPDQSGTTHVHEIVTAGKSGKIYLLDRDNLGHFNVGSDSQIVQWIPPVGSGCWCAPAMWQNYIYFQFVQTFMSQYQLTNGMLSTSPIHLGSGSGGNFPGSTPAISANGNTSGIVWTIQSDGFLTSGPAILHARDATNIATELYNSTQAGSRDTAGVGVKFSVPTVANGKVYVGTQTELDVYGLLP